MNLDRIIQIVHDKGRFMQLPREHYQAIAEATLQAEVEIVTPTSLVSPEQVDTYVTERERHWSGEVANLRAALKAYEDKDPVVIAQRAAAKAVADTPIAAAPIDPAALYDLQEAAARLPAAAMLNKAQEASIGTQPGDVLIVDVPAAYIVPAALADLEHHEAQAIEPAPSPAQAETVAIEPKPVAPAAAQVPPAPQIGAVVG